MNETLQEFVDSRGVPIRVDRERGVVRGVKILGLSSRNGRTYLPEALSQAARLYEGAKVNVNHPKGSPLAPRDYQDRIGVIRRVAARPEEGLFGDFHFNPKHALAAQLAWDAEHAPENVGFSHNVEARTSRRGEQVVVEAITRVQSVDLVADPATTRGLFESAGPASRSAPAADGPGGAEQEKRQHFGELTLEDLQQHRPDLAAALAGEQSQRIAELEAELDRRSAAEAAAQRRLLVRRLLAEHHLPDPDTADGWARSVVSRHFVESLLAAPDEPSMREMIEERARLIRGAGDRAAGRAAGRPLSREQNAGDGPRDAKSFVAAIT
jgi:hypothetical protein